MKKVMIGFSVGILFSTASFVTLSIWKSGAENEIRAELVSDQVGSGSREVLRWRFSAAMVPEEEPVEFSPAVEGTFCWTHPNELTFQPDEGWRGCTTFMATLSKDLRGVDSQPLADPLIFTFHSDPLSVRSISQSNYSSDHRIQLDIAFSDRVSPTQLKTHLKIETTSGNKISYQINRYPNQNTFGITFRSTTANEVIVRVGAGLNSSSGPIGLESNVVQNVKLSRDLRLLRLTPRTQSFGAGYIEARFNLPLDLSTAKELIRVEPGGAITLESQTHYYRHQCRILGDFKPGKSYEITFDPALKSTTGSSLGKAVSQTVYFPDARPALEFTARGTYMSPKGGMKIPFRHIDTKDCKAIVRRVYSNNLVQLAARRSNRYSFYGTPHQNISHLVGELELPLDSPHNEIARHTLDLGSILEGQTGAFHIALRSKQGARSSHYVVVSDLGLSIKQSKTTFWCGPTRFARSAPSPTPRSSSIHSKTRFC